MLVERPLLFRRKITDTFIDLNNNLLLKTNNLHILYLKTEELLWGYQKNNKLNLREP